MHEMTLEHSKCQPPGPVPGEDRLPRTHRQKEGRRVTSSTSCGGILIKGSSGQNPLSFQMVSSRLRISSPPELGWIKGEKQADRNNR